METFIESKEIGENLHYQVQRQKGISKDRAVLDYKEALHIEKVRHEFFHRLSGLVENAGER